MNIIASIMIVAVMTGTAAVAAAAEDDGLIRKPSPYSVDTTAERLEAAVKAKGLKVFPRIDHAAAAREAGLAMRPSIVVAFGNPKYGTPIMVEHPQAGIDFPPRTIIYEDKNGQVWLAYNSAAYFYGTIFRRHGLSYDDKDVTGLETVLNVLTDAAVKPNP